MCMSSGSDIDFSDFFYNDNDVLLKYNLGYLVLFHIHSFIPKYFILIYSVKFWSAWSYFLFSGSCRFKISNAAFL